MSKHAGEMSKAEDSLSLLSNRYFLLYLLINVYAILIFQITTYFYGDISGYWFLALIIFDLAYVVLLHKSLYASSNKLDTGIEKR